jgi:hemerythrin-like domain-containing protein
MTEDPTPAPAISRRRLLVAGGVGLAIGAVGTEIGNLATGSSSASAATTPPDVDLMQEHGVLKRVLMIYQESLRRIDAGQEAPMSEVHDGATIIHDFIEAFHEALEEGYVFPMLRNAGILVSTVDTLFVQHARGRQLTQLILTGSDTRPATSGNTQAVAGAMTAFVRMYEPHEAREDTVVFPAFRASHTPEQLDELAVTFADLQRQQIGPDGFATTVATVAAIEKRLGIYDLDQFTPAPTVQ